MAVFTYNRPEHTRRLLASLEACPRLDECRVYIFSDGARDLEQLGKVNSVRALIREWGRAHRAEVVEQAENRGLAHSIVAGVTQLCGEHGRVIVLEDDLILHPAFIDFMLQALDHYAEDEQVAQVAGFTFPLKTPLAADAFFLPLTTSWGWATWARAWKSFSWDVDEALHRLGSDLQLKSRFDLNGAYPYSEILKQTADGRLNSWAICWYWTTFIREKLTLYPRRSLIWQNGFDTSATHTRSNEWMLQDSLEEFMLGDLEGRLTFPEDTVSDAGRFQELTDFFSRLQSSPSRVTRFKAWLRTRLKLRS